MPADARFCAHCGSDMVVRDTSGWIVFARIMSVIALVIVACPAGAWGGCLLIIAASSPSWLELLYAVSLLGIAGGIIWFTIWAFKKR